MTSYIAITDTETDPEAPLTATLAKKWRDNPIAITEGATGAPKIRRNAIQEFAVGNTVFYRKDAVQSATVGAYSETSNYTFVQAGVIRVTLEHRNTTGTARNQIVLIRAGVEYVLVVWDATFGATYTARSLDVAVIHGDIVVTRAIAITSGTTETRNLQYKNDGTLVWDTLGGRVGT